MKALTQKLGHEIFTRKRLPRLQPGQQPAKHIHQRFSVSLFSSVISAIHCATLRNFGMVPDAQSFSFYDLCRQQVP